VGELGSGNFTSVTTPVQALGLTGCVAVSSGYYHVLALKGDGTVWSWGYNNYGQLGTGNGGINYSIPAQITSLDGVIAIAAGQYHSLALRSDGTVWAWGYNAVGQLGNSTTANSSIPVQVQGLPSNIVAIAAGGYHSLALDANGNVWGWGYDSDGELGFGTSGYSYVNAVQLTSLTGVTAIAGGLWHSLFVSTNGAVWATGLNSSGQLGNNSTAASLVPVQVSGLTGVGSVSAGEFFSSALKTNGTVWTWGDNSARELGNGSTNSISAVPVQVTSLANIVGLSSAGYHNLALQTNGGVVVWGDNSSGQLALGTTNTATVPTISQFIALQLNQAPSAPTGLQLNYNSSGQAVLSWSQAGSLTQSFTIQQSTNGGTTWTTIGTALGSANSFTINGLASGTNYSFLVIANGTYSSSAASATASPLVSLALTGITVAPATITNVATVSSAAGPISRVDFYDAAQYLVSVINPSNSLVFTAVLTNVPAGPHTFTAIANNTNGIVGEGSANVTVTIPPAPWSNAQFANPFISAFYVDSVDQLQGTALSSTNGFSSTPWFKQLALPAVYGVLYSTAYTKYQTNTPYLVTNPWVAFGGSAGGSPLYTGNTYTFAFCDGGLPISSTNFTVYTNQASNNYNASDFQILVYNTSQFPGTNVVPVATNYFSIPRQGSTNWASFQNGGFIYTNTFSNNGCTLTTTVAYNLNGTSQTYLTNGPSAGTASDIPLIITHTASGSSNTYVVNYRGVYYDTNGTQYPLTVSNTNNASNSVTYTYGYTLDFTNRPPWSSTVLSIPNFQGQQIPPAYAGKSLDELLKVSTPVTYQLASTNITNTSFTVLDNSPELRTNPVLDKFISDMGSNPIILANFVLNQIHLSDAISYNAAGSVSDQSINEGGFNRSAQATFLERQGNPAEQCALLIYLLRRCGVPCAYVFPNQNTLQMLDARMSSLLHFQISEMLPNTNNTPQILPVNYPWVVAYDTNSSQWVHIFPWMKDTAVTEGYPISDYLPAGYNTGYGWVRHYLNADTNIMGLNTNDDTLRTLYPIFVANALTSNGLTTNDVGVTIIDRPHNYASWSNFPQPWGMTTNLAPSNIITSLGSTNLIPNLGASTNIFDTMEATMTRSGSTNALLDTGVLRMVDLHNRLFFISTAGATNNSNVVSFYMEPLYDGTTNASAFNNPATINNAQYLGYQLSASDSNNLNFQITYTRHNQLNTGGLTNPAFLGIVDSETVSPGPRPFIKGESAVLCLDYGQVTQQMLDVTAQKFWAAQQSGTMTTNNAIGTQLQLMGMSYYKHCSDLRNELEPLHQAVITSFFGAGLAKLNPQLTNGVLPTNGLVSLRYPAVDMFTAELAAVGNGPVSTINPSSGVSAANTADDLESLFTVGSSAEEHAVLNQFFGMTNSASTVHLLHLAAQTNGVITLTSQNYTNLATNLYSYNGVTNSLQTWASNAGMWSSVTNALTSYATNNTNASVQASFNVVYITPGPELCASNTYAGLGAFLINNYKGGIGMAALISSQSLTNPPLNGGFGAETPAPVSLPNVQNFANLTQNGGGSYQFSIQVPSITAPPLVYQPTIQSAPVAITEISVTGSSTTVTYTPTTDQLQLAQSFSGNQSLNASSAQLQSVISAEFNSGTLASSYTSYQGNNSAPADSSLGKAILDPVDIVRGSFYVNDADLVIPGPMPIKLSRNYDSMYQANGEFGYGWKMGYFAYLGTNSVNTNTAGLIYAAETDGSVIAYSPVTGSTNTWMPTASNNPALCNQQGSSSGSIFNLFNNKIVMSGSGTNATYSLTGSDGSIRTFAVQSFPVGTGTNTISRTRPYLKTWVDPQGNNLSFSFGSNTNSPDYGFLNRISSSNGNFLQLDYDTYGRIIQANAADGWVLSYNYDIYGDLIQVTRPDNSTISYTYQHLPNVAPLSGLYSSHLLLQETKPEGRQLVNTYDGSRRVTQQQVCVGTGGSLAVNATFNYNTVTNSDGTLSGTNSVADAFSHTTTYGITGGQITSITDPLSQTISTTWYPVGSTNSGAYPRSMASRIDKRGLSTTYSYDGNGNLITSTTTGNITGSGTGSAVKATTYNTNNLPTKITEPNGNYETFTYGSAISPYLVTAVSKYAASGGLISTTSTTYTSTGGTSAPFANGLPSSVTQASGSSDAATVNYTYNSSGYPVTETHLSGTSDSNISYTLSYNLRGQLVSKIDSAGQTTTYAYDDLGNQIWQQLANVNGSLVDWHYNYYNENGEIEWTQGAHYNPADYTENSYDAAGRITETMVWNSQATGGGVSAGTVSTTAYTYDAFGNLTKTVDSMGTTTVMTYDAIGQMLTRTKTSASGSALSSETFTYEPGGKVATHTDALGGTTSIAYTQTGLPITQSNPDGTSQAWTYLIDGRPSVITLPNGSIQNLTYNDANRTVNSVLSSGTGNITGTQIFDRRGNLISSTDGAGYTRTTTYDALNRPKIECGPAGTTGSAQQKVTHCYDGAGLSRTDVNALGERTINSFDALGRPTEIDIYGDNGGLARTTAYLYSPDHQSVTITEGKPGSGFTPGSTTIYSDFHGKPILTVKADGTKISSAYDVNENLISTTDEVGNTTSYTYDGLNHLASQRLPDGATISFVYDAAGDLLNRTMPGGLTWSALYNTAGQKTSEKLVGGGSTTRTYSYTYNTTGGGAGQLASMTDPRGIVTTYGYDGFGRATSVAAVDPGSSQLGVTRSYTFDPRNLLTGVTQTYQNTALSPTTQVTRTLDGYGAILSEQTYIGGTLKDTWSLNHDGAGRRNQLLELNNSGLPYTYKYRADGNMVEADFNQGGYYFSYNSDGRLYYRNTPVKIQSIARDGVGRIINSSQSMSGTSLLTESISWKANDNQAANAISRNGAVVGSDSRTYGYDSRSHLTSESYGFPVGNTGGATYQFDGGVAGGLGLRTGITLSALSGTNVATFGTFARLSSMTVSGSLTNNSVGTPVAQNYDAAGNVTTRTAGGSTDTLTWDAFGQLVGDVRAGTGAFTWSAIYDGLGRRLQTTQGGTTIQSSYDPEVEFLDLATTVNNGTSATRYWKVIGPDISGHYGGMQGTGGIEAVYNGTSAATTFLLSDTYGHAEATLTGTTLTWNSSLSDGYGVLPGSSSATALSGSTTNLATVIGWRGHYIDPSGLYYLGARYYAPDSGNFLSPDPLGHSASLDLYSYCDGDPVNNYDPDGRCFEGAVTGQTYNTASSVGASIGLNFGITQLTQTASSLVLQDTLLNQTTLAPVNRTITSLLSSFSGASQGGGYITAPSYIGDNTISPPDKSGMIHDHNIPANAITLNAGNGQGFYAPPNANYQAVLSDGQANGPFDISGITTSVQHYGTYDYQRNQGGGNLIKQGVYKYNTFQNAYTDASNYSVGVYMRGAGYSLFGTDLISGGFAIFNSSNAGAKSQRQWWANGWNDANSSLGK
jgi:RHS repeat-associated protein